MSVAAKESSRYDGTPVYLYKFEGADTAGSGPLGPFTFTNGEDPITRDGLTYAPWPIKHGNISSSGDLDKSMLAVTLARGTALDPLFVAYPPSQVVNLTIFKGHADDPPTVGNFPAEWVGRLAGANYNQSNELAFDCEPVSTSMRTPGLRRNYQLGCPHALFGPQCRANKAAATVTRTVESFSGKNINLTSVLPGLRRIYAGGLVEWTTAGGNLEVRSIVGINLPQDLVTVRGSLRGLTVGHSIKVIFGCNHTMGDCGGLHGNIQNFGGQPWIPLDNPFANVTKFY